MEMTMQDMYDEAAEHGAALYELWACGKCENYYLKVDDEGVWYFVDDKDRRIDEADAWNLKQVYDTGYLPG